MSELLGAEEGDWQWSENRTEWVYINHIRGSIWEAHEYSDGTGRSCEFDLHEAPEDLKCWVLLGLAAGDGEKVINLPNWDRKEYTSPHHSTWLGYYEVKQTAPGKLEAFVPTALLNQIKPIKETK